MRASWLGSFAVTRVRRRQSVSGWERRLSWLKDSQPTGRRGSDRLVGLCEPILADVSGEPAAAALVWANLFLYNCLEAIWNRARPRRRTVVQVLTSTRFSVERRSFVRVCPFLRTVELSASLGSSRQPPRVQSKKKVAGGVTGCGDYRRIRWGGCLARRACRCCAGCQSEATSRTAASRHRRSSSRFAHLLP
jgi:hypothetical protein